MPRIIAHLDMDAFFAAVEERDHEWLHGLPIVVGADPLEGRGRGVVSTANYRARRYGICSAMPISKAWQLSEAAKQKGQTPATFVSADFERYSATSVRIFEILRKHAASVEEASVDEAYFDISEWGDYDKARKKCLLIKKEIVLSEGLTCSIGIGPNKLIAKIASDHKKPDGLTIVTETEVAEFLKPLSIRDIPGIGPKTEMLFKKQSVRTIEELLKFSQENLKSLLGKWGEDLYDKARGIDTSPVVESYEIKSIGEQETFMKDTHDPGFVLGRLEEMSRRVFVRMQKEGFKNFRTISIIVRFADFETKTRARTIPVPSSSHDLLLFEVMKLVMPFFDSRENPRKKLFRLVGIRVEKLGKKVCNSGISSQGITPGT